MNKPKGEVRPIFPAGAVVRYDNPAHKVIELDRLEFFPNVGSGSYSTSADRNVLLEPEFVTLAAFLRECVTDYLDNVYCYRYDRFDISAAWVNRTPAGGAQRMHCHGNSIVSGVYYLHADAQRSSPLVFEKPELNSQPYIAIAAREQTMFTANRVAYPASTGVAYLFPSQLRHGYDVPTRGEERVSLAFNVLLAGVGLFYRL